MEDRIYNTTPIKEARDILDSYGISLGNGWEIAMAMMLQSCDYITIHGFGKNALFVLNTISIGGKDETTEEINQRHETKAF